MHLDQGRFESAEPLFAKARSLQPDSVAALFGLGRAALARKDYVRAVEYLEASLALDQRPSVLHYQLAMAYRGLGQLERAESHLARSSNVEINPPDPLMEELDGLLESGKAYQSRGIRALEQGQWADAASYFRKGAALDPSSPWLRHGLGTALFQTGDAGGALEQFEEALRRSPTFARAHYSAGVVLASNGRYREAIERFSAALKHEPHYVEARQVLADALREIGRPEEALRHYELILTTDPRFADARFGSAMALVRLERYQQARDRLTEATAFHPDRPEFAHALTRLLAAAPRDRVRDGRRAMELMQGLLKLPRSVELSETMAMTLAETGRYQEAAAWQREAIAAASRAGRDNLATEMGGNLKLYELNRPCRTPWSEGELP